ncbi:MAG: DUF4097 family beta strand repeat protein [Streptosporangiales bacterium]|nr:DUF4097 family beta strand repeat protein [Streptosporangiales bacterium]MBO0889825.1 DUF4097 family beta strand repeat protein [Acidothermales bacterium]
MPTFQTPEPIAVTIDMAAGSVRVAASDRTDTVVDVRPYSDSSDADVRAAAETGVDYAGGRLTVKGPKSWVRSVFGPGAGPAIDVVVELPQGSSLDLTSWTDLTADGRLGDVTVRTALGDIRLEATGELRAKTSMGDITVGRIDGGADLDTSAGAVRIGRIDGSAVVKASAGGLSVGEVAGDLRLHTSHGDISVERALASVVAKTAAGGIRVDEAVRGRVDLATSYGDVTVGVPEGTAAWLDVNSRTGRVRSELEASTTPRGGDETVEIRARTQYGEILIRRA